MQQSNGCRGVLAGAYVLLALAFVGCAGDGTTGPPDPASLEVMATRTRLVALGDTTRLRAVARDASGAELSSVGASWSTSAPGTVRVDSTGLVTALANGSATITATLNDLSDAVTLTVEQEIARLRVVAGDAQEGRAGDALADALTVRAEDARQHGIRDAAVTWSVATGAGRIEPSAARTDEQGLAGAVWTLGFAREQRVAAEVQGATPAEFGATAVTRCVVPASSASGGAAGRFPDFTVIEVDATDLDVATGLPIGNAYGAVADLEGDGDDDFVVLAVRGDDPHGSGAVLVYRNDGTGSFTREVTSVPSDRIMPRAVITLDANGDGLEDVFVAQHGYDSPPWPGKANPVLVQDGGTLVDHGPTLLQPDHEEFTHGAASADVDCDGDADLYEANVGPDSSHLRINDGTALLPDDDRIPAGALDGGYNWAGFCDVDRDGDEDLLLVDGPGRELLLNDGFGWFTSAPTGALPPANPELIGDESACADMDLDGWPDIVAGFGQETADVPYLSYWRNNRDGAFTDLTASHVPQTWTDDFGLAVTKVADMNGDGLPDIIASGGRDMLHCSIFINEGGDGFAQLWLPDIADDPNEWCGWFYPLDADGDGRMDLMRLRGHTGPVLLRQR